MSRETFNASWGSPEANVVRSRTASGGFQHVVPRSWNPSGLEKLVRLNASGAGSHRHRGPDRHGQRDEVQLECTKPDGWPDSGRQRRKSSHFRIQEYQFEHKLENLKEEWDLGKSCMPSFYPLDVRLSEGHPHKNVLKIEDKKQNKAAFQCISTQTGPALGALGCDLGCSLGPG